MENNIRTLYILELDSFVVKSAKISTILCHFVQKIFKKIVYSCCHGSHDQRVRIIKRVHSGLKWSHG